MAAPKTSTAFCLAGMVTGFLLIVIPLFLSVYGIADGFRGITKELSTPGPPEPNNLAVPIVSSLFWASTAFALCTLGGILLLVSVVVFFLTRTPKPPPLPPGFGER